MKVLKCSVCGNVVGQIIDHGVPVMCCGKPMVELNANTSDGAMEKHVPVAAVKEGKLEVVVGSVEHPMLEEHYITHIWAVAGDQVLRAALQPGNAPKAVFDLNGYKGKVEVYEYCNLHGLWKCEVMA